jgi:hypothetical protein
MRRSDGFLVALAVLAGLVGLAGVDAWMRGGRPPPEADAPARELVRTLGLTDLALATEARYTRHRALADRHAAFQDHPGALDHFPSGAALAPPAHLTPPDPAPAGAR